MATCNFIKNSHQNPSGMYAVIRYVSQDVKTLDANETRYLSGVNCIGQAAYDEFMATKNLFGKRQGIWYYHYEQSFAPGEIASYEEAHSIGTRLAEEMFPGFEVLVGTHLDATTEDGVQRVHNHLIVNSVSYKDGRKLHTGPRTLEQMRAISDRLCTEHDLSVLPTYKQTYDKKHFTAREYRAAISGRSYKMQAVSDIETAMTMAGSKEEFIALLESVGYGVLWTDSRKYITYTCPNGMKVRDNKLHENKFLKESMEYEFYARKQSDNTESGTGQFDLCTDEAIKQRRITDDEGYAVSAAGIRYPEGSLERGTDLYGADDGISHGDLRADGYASDEERSDRSKREDVGSGQPLGDKDNESDDGSSGRDCAEGSNLTERNTLPHLTGWEDARRIYEANRSAERGTSKRPLGVFAYDEDPNAMVSHRNGDRLGTAEHIDLSASEISAFFDPRANDAAEVIDDEEEAANVSFHDLCFLANQGNAYALYRLGCMCMDENSPHYDPERGEEYLYEAAEAGNPWAEYRLGKMFYFGIWFEADSSESEYWLIKSSDHGNSFAQTMLGRAWIEGGFFNFHREEGFRLLFEAEEAGNSHAAYTLGKYYMEGKVVKKDLGKAIAHLEKADQMGDPFALYQLAKIYLFEWNMRDWDRAIEYLNISAHMGNTYAADALRRMSEHSVLCMFTSISSVVAGLDSIADRRPIEDCTTIRQPRQKKKNGWEQTM